MVDEIYWSYRLVNGAVFYFDSKLFVSSYVVLAEIVVDLVEDDSVCYLSKFEFKGCRFFT